jgi:hypothetical protein
MNETRAGSKSSQQTAGGMNEEKGVPNSKKFSFHEIRCYLPV